MVDSSCGGARFSSACARRANDNSRHHVRHRPRREAPPPPAVVKQFGIPPELITQFTGTVVFAGGRGRLDITAVARRTPTVRTEGIVLGPPLAAEGTAPL